MPLEKIVLRPGVNTQATPLLNEASWSVTNLVRFFQGLLQKIGGWQRIINTALTGTCRGLLAWADLAGNAYVAAGTEQRLQVVISGTLFDITPLRRTANLNLPFESFSGTGFLDALDVGSNATGGDWIYIVTPASIGGQVLQGFYQIYQVFDADSWALLLPNNFTSTVNPGGTTALFNVTNGSADVAVTLNNHGLSMGSVYTVYVSTTVGGITLFGDYVVASVTNANVFHITAAGGASSTTSGSENGGNVRIEYLIQTGLVSNGIAQGYGNGGYGYGPYGIGGSSSTVSPLRQWSLDAWGQQLLASPSYGSLYFWDPTGGVMNNQAAIVSGSPAQMTGFFVAMPQQQVVTYGATDPGTGNIDPMLIRWSDVADYNTYTATVTNQAGSFRLPRGSKTVGGIQGPQYGLLWTDLALWAMGYIQPPLVYGFNEIATGCGLIAQRARCIQGTDVFWMSQSGFFQYSNGAVQPLPCPVWDVIFKNLFSFQADKICLGADTPFNEFFAFYPSLTGNGENDSYVKYNKIDQVWDYGSLIRTAWIDQSVVGPPLGVDGNGLIQQHETSSDGDGSSIISTATSGWFKLNDGQLFIFIERMIPDFVLTGGATVTIKVLTADYPDDTPTVYGPYNVTTATEYFIIRSRSRLARVQISSTADLGSFWRLGEMIYMATPSGRR